MADEKDPPIEEASFIGGVKVIDIGDIRVARGFSRRPFSACKHFQIVYDRQERRIWCKDCERDIEGFDAFELLAANFAQKQRELERREETIAAAKVHVIHLIACKVLESVWRGRKMAPACPHCKGGLLPEDFSARGSMVSAEIERQRRKNALTKT